MPANTTLTKIKSRFTSLASDDRYKRLAFTGIFFLLAFMILGYLVYRERASLLGYRWDLQPVPALLSFPIYITTLVIGAGIWGGIMNTLSKKLAYATHFRYFAISNAAKRLPGTIWYIAGRAHFYRAEGIDPRLTSLASGMELLISTIASILVSLIFGFTLLIESTMNIIAVTILLAICGILLHPRSFNWLAKLLKIEIVQLNYITIIKWITASCFQWIVGGILLFTIGNILTPIPIQQLGYVVGSFCIVGALSTAVFFLPSNFGISEVGLSLFLAQILPAHIAVAIAVGFRLLVTLYDLIWAGLRWKILPPRPN